MWCFSMQIQIQNATGKTVSLTDNSVVAVFAQVSALKEKGFELIKILANSTVSGGPNRLQIDNLYSRIQQYSNPAQFIRTEQELLIKLTEELTAFEDEISRMKKIPAPVEANLPLQLAHTEALLEEFRFQVETYRSNLVLITSLTKIKREVSFLVKNISAGNYSAAEVSRLLSTSTFLAITKSLANNMGVNKRSLFCEEISSLKSTIDATLNKPSVLEKLVDLYIEGGTVRVDSAEDDNEGVELAVKSPSIGNIVSSSRLLQEKGLMDNKNFEVLCEIAKRPYSEENHRYIVRIFLSSFLKAESFDYRQNSVTEKDKKRQECLLWFASSDPQLMSSDQLFSFVNEVYSADLGQDLLYGLLERRDSDGIRRTDQLVMEQGDLKSRKSVEQDLSLVRAPDGLLSQTDYLRMSEYPSLINPPSGIELFYDRYIAPSAYLADNFYTFYLANKVYNLGGGSTFCLIAVLEASKAAGTLTAAQFLTIYGLMLASFEVGYIAGTFIEPTLTPYIQKALDPLFAMSPSPTTESISAFKLKIEETEKEIANLKRNPLKEGSDLGKLQERIERIAQTIREAENEFWGKEYGSASIIGTSEELMSIEDKRDYKERLTKMKEDFGISTDMPYIWEEDLFKGDVNERYEKLVSSIENIPLLGLYVDYTKEYNTLVIEGWARQYDRDWDKAAWDTKIKELKQKLDEFKEKAYSNAASMSFVS